MDRQYKFQQVITNKIQKMKKLFFIQLFGSALLLGACSTHESKQSSSQANSVMVKTYKVNHNQNTTDKEYIGVVEEGASASISFPVNGTIEKINVVEGQRVKKGELLAELNAYNLKSAHDASFAMLKQAEDAMKRLQSLYDKNSLPEIKYIEMKTNLEKARAAEAIARRNLENSCLYAPFTGIVGNRMVNVGENVLPNQTVLTLLQIEDIKIKIAVPEKEINAIHIGQTATARVSATNDQYFSGKVCKKGVVADLISHTYPIRILINNQNNTLLPGMVCNVSINDDSESQSIIIPNQCILTDGNGNSFVWKIVDNHSQKQLIKIGKQKGDGVEVLSGLAYGDQIISEGYQKMSGGLKVEVL